MRKNWLDALRRGENVSKEEIKIAVVGLGTVGAGVVKALRRNRRVVRARCGADVAVRYAVDVDRKRLRATPLPKRCQAADYRVALDDPEIQIVVELIGGTTAALDLIVSALKAGKHVVTANKALLAKHWRRIFSLAHKRCCAIGYESSVMAGVPVIRALQEGLAGNSVSSLFGILNGTSNFVLTRMENERVEFKPALAEARRRGFCEADASLDIDGDDAAQKLSILGSIALRTWLPPSKICREGIGHLERLDLDEAREQFGYAIRPLAILKRTPGAVEARVHPTLVPLSHPLAAVEEEFNAVLINADTAGAVMLTGRGAGEKPAASGVISDIVSLSRAIRQGGGGSALAPLRPVAEKLVITPAQDVESKFYLRFSVVDRPNVLSYIAGALGKQGVSIDRCHQRGRSEKGAVPVFMITHCAREGAVRRALAEIDSARRIIRRKTVAIRIEE